MELRTTTSPTYSWSAPVAGGSGPTTYQRLTEALHAAQGGRGAEARDALRSIVAEHVDRNDPEQLRDVIFASALTKRITGETSASANLYLRQFERPQIALFNLLARHLPTVSLAGRVANEMICHIVEGLDEFTLLDVGIGTAQQEVALLYKLARRGALPHRLTIVAVEPSADSLRAAEAALTETARRLHVELTFRGIHRVAEAMHDAEWAGLTDGPRPLIVLSAFAAHHVRDAASDIGPAPCARDAMFRQLRALEPLALVLCEPNADHHTPSFERRFESCWRHFGLTFDLIDRLDIFAADKAAMKMFFAREIEDILVNAEESRCERHEPVASWVARLRRTGFTPCQEFGFARGFATEAVRVSANDGYVGLDHQDETLVAVLCATSQAGTALLRRRAGDRAVAIDSGGGLAA